MYTQGIITKDICKRKAKIWKLLKYECDIKIQLGLECNVSIFKTNLCYDFLKLSANKLRQKILSFTTQFHLVFDLSLSFKKCINYKGHLLSQCFYGGIPPLSIYVGFLYLYKKRFHEKLSST